MKPFVQSAFRELPELPRIPHPYFSTRAESVVVRSAFREIETHYRIHGEGPPLLLVHGLMTGSYSWRYVLEPLAKHYTLYIPDLPGHGRTEKPDAIYSPEAFSSFVGGFIQTMGIEGCRVIGNSLGGYLCMLLALGRPELVGRLVTLHAPGVPLKRLSLLHGVMSTPGALGLVRRLVRYHPELWVHKNVHYYDESLKSREETREYAAPLRTDEGVRAFGQILRDALAPRALARFLYILDGLEHFPVPLQMVYAETDPLVPPKVAHRLRKALPSAEWVTLTEASHFAHVDNPSAFLNAVLPFLARR